MSMSPGDSPTECQARRERDCGRVRTAILSPAQSRRRDDWLMVTPYLKAEKASDDTVANKVELAGRKEMLFMSYENQRRYADTY
jgi:hypothetical protein